MMKYDTSNRQNTRMGPVATMMILALGTGWLSGCIQVRAPDKPIEINLNVKVQQEVIVRLQKDAEDLIQNNPELFPS